MTQIYLHQDFLLAVWPKNVKSGTGGGGGGKANPALVRENTKSYDFYFLQKSNLEAVTELLESAPSKISEKDANEYLGDYTRIAVKVCNFFSEVN